VVEAERADDVLVLNHDAFRDAGLAPVRRLARPDAVVCDVWNMFGTGKTLFRLSES